MEENTDTTHVTAGVAQADAQSDASERMAAASTGIECPKCYRLFKNKTALRMHDGRVHTKKLGSGYQWKKKRQMSEKERQERRSIYQKRLRARYRREGKDSRGYPKRTSPFTWSPQQRAKFESTWRSKNRAKRKAMARVGRTMFDAGGKKPKPIVYPDPFDTEITETVANIRAEEELQNVTIPKVIHCPRCGEHVGGWKYQP